MKHEWSYSNTEDINKIESVKTVSPFEFNKLLQNVQKLTARASLAWTTLKAINSAEGK